MHFGQRGNKIRTEYNCTGEDNVKLIHLSDLHIGIKVNEFSMIEDQKYILTKILNITDEEKPDGVIIAGDIYDKAVPSAEAVELFDDFICRLARRGVQIFIISGNHDSAERLAFCSRLIDASGVHFSPVYNGCVEPFEMKDGYGTVRIYMLPFLKPANVRRFYPEETIENYTDALRTAISGMNVETEQRNVLVTHQFVTGAARSDSEDISVGGTDNVDAEVFHAFDYVALGHIHGPQNIEEGRIRYCGTPLKYSFSEKNHKKSVTVVELKEKGVVETHTVPLEARHDMKELKGTYDELTLKSFYAGKEFQEDYLHITLTDEDDVPEAMAKLRVIYPNLMKLDYDNRRTRHIAQINADADVEEKRPLDLFSKFYAEQNGIELTDEQRDYISKKIAQIWEGEEE